MRGIRKQVWLMKIWRGREKVKVWGRKRKGERNRLEKEQEHNVEHKNEKDLLSYSVFFSLSLWHLAKIQINNTPEWIVLGVKEDSLSLPISLSLSSSSYFLCLCLSLTTNLSLLTPPPYTSHRVLNVPSLSHRSHISIVIRRWEFH